MWCIEKVTFEKQICDRPRRCLLKAHIRERVSARKLQKKELKRKKKDVPWGKDLQLNMVIESKHFAQSNKRRDIQVSGKG